MTADNTLVSTKAITKSYGSGDAAQLVLKGIDLTIEKGSLVALQGRSGSGKSTLLSILGTLLQPSGGSHEMLGMDLIDIPERALAEFRNSHLGFVFQFHHLLPDFTALENVVFPAAVSAGRETLKARRRARELLEQVGLADRIDYRATELSGGQKQRVAIARALMNAPELVLADEPTGNLDRESADQVMDLIDAINRDIGTTFLISTHDEKIAARCHDEIHLDEGQIVDA